MLLIDRDAVGLFQVFLHAWDVIGHERWIVFSLDEVRDIIHWSRPVEGIHRYQVLEDRRMELTQIFLHSGRLKLERAHRAPFLIELISGGIINRNFLQIDVNASREFDVLDSIFQLRQRLQSQEVHLDKSGIFYHMPVILRTKHFLSLIVRIFCR